MRLRDEELARRAETKIEQFELRAISSQIDGPFIAPWWFSPAVSYWSRQAGVGGSSHESIQGIVEIAKFFGAQDAEEAMQIIDRHNVIWIVSYDADRVAQNSAQILGNPVPKNALVLFARPSPQRSPTIFASYRADRTLQALSQGEIIKISFFEGTV